jgi:hypothetical protein
MKTLAAGDLAVKFFVAQAASKLILPLRRPLERRNGAAQKRTPGH